jgi:hypothetical protein
MEELLYFLTDPNPPEHEKIYVGKVPKDWITDHQPFINEKGEVYLARHKKENQNVTSKEPEQNANCKAAAKTGSGEEDQRHGKEEALDNAEDH